MTANTLPELKYTKLNGFKIAYRQWGESGRPLVLLHGFPTASILWQYHGEYLSRHGWCVYAPDMMGLGCTTGPLDGDHSLAGQAEIVQLFIDELIGQTPYALIGHDLGGGVAQVLAAKPNNGIDIMVLSNSVAFATWPPNILNPLIFMAKRLPRALFKFMAPFIKWRFKQGMQQGAKNSQNISVAVLKDLSCNLFEDEKRLSHFICFMQSFDNRITQAASPSLSQFCKPLMLIWARDDKYHTLETAKKLADVAPHSALLDFDGCHFHPFEQDDMASIFQQQYEQLRPPSTDN